MPHRIPAVTPPSPYALGAPAPSSGWRVHQQCRHYRHLLSLLRRLAKLSGDARPDGRQPAFAWGHVARGRNPYPPRYRTAFASSILPCPHVYQLALRLAFPPGRRTGLPCSVSVTTNGVGALYPPVACDAHDKEGENPCTRYSALLAQACQHLWLVVYDDVSRAFTWVRHTIHPSPSPPDAGRYALPSRFWRQSRDCGSIVRRRCTRRYLLAHLRRIPLMGQRVVSWHHAKHNND
jgi:hypothetical protein